MFSLLAMFLVPAALVASEPSTSDKLQARVDALGREAVEKDGVPGLSIAVGRNGNLLIAKGFGYADAKRGVPATEDTRYPIGSLTRQFTAVAILKLEEQKKLSIDDDLAKWLPDFPLGGQSVTLQSLLANTSGVPGYDKLAVLHGSKLDRPLTRDELFGLFRDVPFDFAPGSEFSSNNSGYLLLSMVVAKASGRQYTDFVQANLLEPVGMEQTRFDPWDDRQVGFARDCRELSTNRELEIPLLGSPATATQSLSSTVKDLFRWQCAIDDRMLIDESSTRKLLTSTKLDDGTETGMGFATRVSEDGGARVYSHTGGLGGFRVQVAHYEPSRLTVVVLANCSSAPVEGLEQSIARAALDLLPTSIVDLPLDPADLRTYSGTWQIATTRVRTYARDGKLWFEGTSDTPTRLMYQGQHRFVSSVDGSMRFTFHCQDDKRAESFEIERNGLVTVAKRMD